MTNYALSMENIIKRCGPVQVLKNANLQVRKGDIHALLGENGGKSTLMNVLGGVTECDGGTIRVDGNEVKFHKPLDSQEKGIAFIHQELNVINGLAVYENMFLGYELRHKSGRLNAKEMCSQTEQVFKRMNVNVNPRAMVRDLQASIQIIAKKSGKAILRNAQIIMDEPTTSLTEPKRKECIPMMKKLTEEGTTIIFISHKHRGGC